MCGIAGVASISSLDYPEWLKEVSQLMAHRGPDHEGFWKSECGHVQLLHRRLSIVDVTTLGNQPFTSFNERYTIVLNGEIYNHKELRRIASINDNISWRGRSDTESLVNCIACIGLDNALKKAVGMFSFALHDKLENKVFLVRDRAGEKPLYFCNDLKNLYFASELTSLIRIDKSKKYLSRMGIESYLGLGYANAPLSLVDGCHKLEPGKILEFDLDTGSSFISTYWRLPGASPSTFIASENEIEERVRFLLERSVSLIADIDVPFGLLLSGGVDSSLVAALASKHVNSLKTYTVSFPGENDFDESCHAQKVANYLGTEHTQINAQDVDMDLLYTLGSSIDEPISDSSLLPTYIVFKSISETCKVAIGGDGADEVFGGYTYYRRLAKLYKSLPRYGHSISSFISFIGEYFLPTGTKGKNWILSPSTLHKGEIPCITGLFTYSERKKIFSNSQISFRFAEDRFNQYKDKDNDFITNLLGTDFSSYLPSNILHKIDRCSMINSVEVRAPFLDYRLVEFAFTQIPPALKVTPKSTKILLKNIVNKLFKDRINFDRKQGFSIPLKDFFENKKHKDFIYDMLTSKDSIFSVSEVSNLIRLQEQGFRNQERLFSLALFESWRKHNNLTLR